MKKIIFNATILADKPNGLSLYCKNILFHINKDIIDEVIKQKEYSLPDNINLHNKVISIDSKKKNKFISILFRNLFFNKYVKKISKESNVIIYSPTQHGIVSKNIRQIITIHDLIPLFYPKGRYHQYIYYKFLLPLVIKNCEKIVTVSKNTKKDILENYNIDSNKIEVVYNGFDRPKEININKSKKYIKDKYNIENYILMMGINYRYKNIHNVIKVMHQLKNKINKKLVIAGNNNVTYGRELLELTKKLGLEEVVIFIGYISDEDKHNLYQAAELFIYPSMYEGFGLPVLEAMSNKTIVVCSNTSSLPEIAGEAALYVNPNNLESIRLAILRVCTMTIIERELYIQKGAERANNFSWDKCASDVEAIIKEVSEVNK